MMSDDLSNATCLPEKDQTCYRMLFEEMLEGFAILQRMQGKKDQTEDYRFIYVNPAFKHIPGFPQDKVIGKNVWQIFPDNKEKLTQTLDKVYLSGNPATIELYSAKHDIFLSTSIFRSKSKQIGCIFRDISEKKRIESMLHAERDSLSNVLEGTNAGNWHWNVQSGELTVNERWATITGYTLEELLPVSLESWKKTTHPEDIPKAMDALDRLFRGKASYYDVEFRQRHKDGHWVWVNSRGKVIKWAEDGKPLLMSGIHLDITNRKLAEHALQESKENLRVTLNSIGDAVIATDISGCITQMNPVAETLTGWPSNEAKGKFLTSVFKIVNSQTRRDAPNPVERVLATGETVTLANHTLLIARDGSEHQTADSGAPIRSIKGEIIGVVLVFRDITSEYALQEQLRQAQKMEAVGQLAGGIAHDFNNLLQAILGYGEIALAKIKHQGTLHDSIEQIIKAGTQAKTMTSQLLAFSRRQVLQMVILDLNEVVNDLTKIILRLIGEHINLDIKTGNALSTVQADRSQLGQILTNLCVNARDAMPEGGTITIETSTVNLDQQYCENHIWAKPGKYVVLSVTDTGYGMSNEIIEHACDPFFSTKEVGKGSGLGLSTVYGLVQQHEGIIKIESEIGKGTTVNIYLLSVDDHVASPCKPESEIQQGTETILLAEDDAMVRDVCTGILEMGGYNVLAACNGEEALQLFNENKDRIDLTLLDVVMPKMGGKMVYDRIREIQPKMRFLFTSGYSMGDLHTNFILDQGISLIQKPYDSTDLLKKVRGILDQD